MFWRCLNQLGASTDAHMTQCIGGCLDFEVGTDGDWCHTNFGFIKTSSILFDCNILSVTPPCAPLPTYHSH
ncbi:hypothetical protein AQUCO_03800090v1 [Aquilegia coerulea]|uniref:Uncharacterized protein n=1 Tax=Aquilegia coerulea TaxID=218851 RepID=A0A2G5CST3_AQUCA|nr:hypothetical protein AQUCO_03800090v1 [Aquilegia coerulea]